MLYSWFYIELNEKKLTLNAFKKKKRSYSIIIVGLLDIYNRNMSWSDWNYTRTNENMSQLYGHLRNDKKSESPLMAYANYYQNNSNKTNLLPNWYTSYSNTYTQQPEQVVNYRQEYLKVSSPPNRLFDETASSRLVNSGRTRTAHPFLRISSSQQSFDDESLKHSDSGRIEDFHGSSQRLYEDYVRRQAEKKKLNKLDKKKDGGDEMNSEFHTIYELVEQFG